MRRGHVHRTPDVSLCIRASFGFDRKCAYSCNTKCPESRQKQATVVFPQSRSRILHLLQVTGGYTPHDAGLAKCNPRSGELRSLEEWL